MHPDPWPPHDTTIPDVIVKRGFVAPPGYGRIYTYAVCGLCGTPSFESSRAGDPNLPNQLGRLTWLHDPMRACAVCTRMFSVYPEVAQWVARVMATQGSILQGRIDQVIDATRIGEVQTLADRGVAAPPPFPVPGNT